MAARTSKEMEIKLTNVARAFLLSTGKGLFTFTGTF